MEKLNPAYKDKLLFLLKDIVGVNRFFEKQSQEFLKKNKHIEQGEPFLDIDTLNASMAKQNSGSYRISLLLWNHGLFPLREHIPSNPETSISKKTEPYCYPPLRY